MKKLAEKMKSGLGMDFSDLGVPDMVFAVLYESRQKALEALVHPAIDGFVVHRVKNGQNFS